jgi:hypothetical protein
MRFLILRRQRPIMARQKPIMTRGRTHQKESSVVNGIIEITSFHPVRRGAGRKGYTFPVQFTAKSGRKIAAGLGTQLGGHEQGKGGAGNSGRRSQRRSFLHTCLFTP